MRILIADDEDALRRALAAILRVWGHQVVEARNGCEALAAATGEDPPDIAILDWDMPNLSGIDVCRHLRAKPELPYTYVILLTGKGSRDDRIQGLDAGADDYIVKPFDPRSDIYSSGVVLYQMVTGRVPFLARSPLSILAKHVLEEPQRPIELDPTIDPLLDAVILKAMSKDPSARYQTARELRSDLRALLGRARSRDLATQTVQLAAV